MNWTARKVETLRQLWADGKSARKIGLELGTTKNAVIGRAHRLGLPARPIPKQFTQRPPPPPRPKPPRRACEWPFGDPGEPDFHFCGAAVFSHAPYCQEHLLRAHRKQAA